MVSLGKCLGRQGLAMHGKCTCRSVGDGQRDLVGSIHTGGGGAERLTRVRHSVWSV